MSTPIHLIRWLFWPIAVILILGTTFTLWWYSQPRRNHQPVSAAVPKDKDKTTPADPDDANDPPETPSVSAVRPRTGAMERVTVQAGSVEADEVHLYSMVTGILKLQPVLIGQRVKRGDVLAVIDVPELEMQVKRNAALVDQAEARVNQMKEKVTIAKADAETARAKISYAEANAKAATALLIYRTSQHKRTKELTDSKTLEDKVLDEVTERKEAAREAENAAKAAIVTSKAEAMASEARIALAGADLLEAKAQVKIAEAELGKSRVMLAYAHIGAPFDGIITQRTYYQGATVRAIGEKGGQAPLLTIQRTDLMRVVVQIPDNEARYADAGDPVYIEIDAFRGMKFDATVSRIADTEDAQTRLMRVEIDLPNPQGKIRQGMYGKVTIILDKEKDKLSIPATCLAHGKSDEVYVVKDGKAQLTKLTIGLVSNERVMVLKGLDTNDRVILNPPGSLRSGDEVQAADLEEIEPKTVDQP